ncbi:MAG: ATP synthase F1 subunit gamma [Chitinispirillaceae bacterium]|nr:ATP synthase F1 subunit gamma [Chitinispirillaceae bacterium]
MQSIREFNDKLKSLKNTRKITGSMKLVSTVKFQKFSRLKPSAVRFSQSVDIAASKILSFERSVKSKNKKSETRGNKALILFFTADRGLCGRYNTNVFRETLRISEQLKNDSLVPVYCCSGLKGYTYLSRYNLDCDHFFNSASANPDVRHADEIARYCLSRYLSGEINSVYLVYSLRRSSLSEEVIHKRVLPYEPEDGTASQETDSLKDNLILENKPEVALKQMYQMKMFSSVYKTLVEAAESEHSARMNAMETATTNCDRMIQYYQQLRNRARQTAITTELSEIVTGKEALEQN